MDSEATHWTVGRARVPGARYGVWLVDEAIRARTGVGAPAVGHDGGAGFDRIVEERPQALRFCVGDDAHPGSGVAASLAQLDGDRRQRLTERAAPGYARFLAAEEGLVDLDTHRGGRALVAASRFGTSGASSTPSGRSRDPAAAASSAPTRPPDRRSSTSRPRTTPSRRCVCLKDRPGGPRHPLGAPSAAPQPTGRHR